MSAPHEFDDGIGPNLSGLPNEIDEKVILADADSKPKTPRSSSQLDQIRKVVMSFLHDMSYEPTHIPRNVVLEQAVMCTVRSWGIDDGHGGEVFKRIAKYVAAISNWSYNRHEFDVKLQIAVFTFFLTYIDDFGATMPTAIQSFQERMYQRLPQLHPVLTYLVHNLSDMYIFFEPLSANSIVCSALEFINGCTLEINEELAAMGLKHESLEWPGFLRAKTGAGAAYAFMIFPEKGHPSMVVYVRAIADISSYICMTNDILSSFYKEDGGEGNYINNRSKTCEEDPVKVLADVSREALAARNRVIALLETEPEALAAWKVFEQGYITFHTSQKRYRLGELDPSLAEELL